MRKPTVFSCLSDTSVDPLAVQAHFRRCGVRGCGTARRPVPACTRNAALRAGGVAVDGPGEKPQKSGARSRAPLSLDGRPRWRGYCCSRMNHVPLASPVSLYTTYVAPPLTDPSHLPSEE